MVGRIKDESTGYILPNKALLEIGMLAAYINLFFFILISAAVIFYVIH